MPCPVNPAAICGRKPKSGSNSASRGRAKLFASHKEQRERDLRSQQQAVERVAQEQARIAENKRQSLEQHERKWDQMRDRIAYKPAPAPSPSRFG